MNVVQERGDLHVYLWLIHVDVWQKPIQYCEVICLQLKINKFGKNRIKNIFITKKINAC